MKTAVITGGSDGIGKALCQLYGANGYSIVFTGRNSQKLQEVSLDLAGRGIRNLPLQLDASSSSDNVRLVKEALAAYGRIDVLICNAGVSMRSTFQQMDPKAFDQVMKINFEGPVSLIRAALPALIESRGSIIGISSINGRRATPARTAYAASKYALEGFLESLRMELMVEQVHILVACPGFTRTNMRRSALMSTGDEQGKSKLDESQMMDPAVVAKKIFEAMLRKKRDLILTRNGKLAVLANKFIPSLMDRIVFRFMAKKPDSPFYQR